MTMRLMTSVGRAALPLVAAAFAVGLATAPAWAATPARPTEAARRPGWASGSANTTAGTWCATTTAGGTAWAADGTGAF